MSLIAGMDNVVEYIKKLEQENKKLKENKYDKFKCDVCKGHHTGCSDPTCNSCVEELKEENKKLKNIENNDKQEMYAILEDLKEENKFYWESMEKLKEENEKLKLSNQQYIDMFNFVVKSEEEKVDKIEKLKEENTILTNYRNCMDKIQKEFIDIEDIVDVLPFMKSKEEENLKLRQQNRMKDDMMKNMILSLVATPSSDFEYEIKDDYSVKYNRQYNKDVEEYFEKIVKEMNDTDWNDDNNALSLVYEDYNINVLFNHTDDDE
tara:strand:- start:1578 stop:2369 length:792 start_codon:yes stop_codon:yes gene_type:complete